MARKGRVSSGLKQDILQKTHMAYTPDSERLRNLLAIPPCVARFLRVAV